ncbi:MAG: cytochrome c3 family protein [Pyrinomonadaceae bacterium]
MPQIFHHSANALVKLSVFGGIFILVLVSWAWAQLNYSGYNTSAGLEVAQPIQFSHKHHAGDDGIDCRYCHTSVETSSFAGIPPTTTCMNCHKQLWADAPYLEPVRASLRDNKPMVWQRVHDLPDYVYFNHSIHVGKGVGCATCHGRIDQMPAVFQKSSLQMSWCIACHRAPEKFLRDKDKVVDMEYPQENTTDEQLAHGAELKLKYKIKSKEVMTSCSTCHR